jgi:hypothetical protein
MVNKVYPGVIIHRASKFESLKPYMRTIARYTSKFILKIHSLLTNLKNLIKLPKIFNWFYTTSGYYCIKSGFYIDHFFKTFFNKISKEIFFFWGLIFLDSFIVNRLIINLFNFLSNFFYKIYNLKKKLNSFHIKIIVITFIIIIIITFIVLY